MSIERKKVLVGYETIKGVIFAKYENQLIEDGKITDVKLERSTITSEAYDALKKADFVDQVLLNHATEFCKISVELLNTKDVLTKECSEKMILQTELLTHKETIKAHEENFKMAKTINDEIYAENQKLKADKEKLLADMVKLDENIVNLNAQIVTLKESKKVK